VDPSRTAVAAVHRIPRVFRLGFNVAQFLCCASKGLRGKTDRGPEENSL
jgi:hypothetical protein